MALVLGGHGVAFIVGTYLDFFCILVFFRMMPRLQEAHRASAHRSAKKAFFRIMQAWSVSDSEAQVLLGQPSRSTFYAYKKGEGGSLAHDTLERVSYVLGIYKALQLLFPDAAQADAWMQKPNAAFGGKSALAHALGGRVVDLAEVRTYLDGVRGGAG
ncbi:MAG: antitoxin Xre/MbcA/ParS toxin-binding domain-containing protein [Myxococcota bacterium]